MFLRAQPPSKTIQTDVSLATRRCQKKVANRSGSDNADRIPDDGDDDKHAVYILVLVQDLKPHLIEIDS